MNSKFWKFLFVILIIFCLLNENVLAFKKGEKGKDKKKEQKKKPDNFNPNEELKVQVLSQPQECERKTQQGDKLTIHYNGYLPDGTMFDSSELRGSPLDIVLGSQGVLPGWNAGLVSMCVGEKRKLIIPPRYAFGEEGYPPVIPARTTITFEIELIAIGDANQEEEPVEEEFQS